VGARERNIEGTGELAALEMFRGAAPGRAGGRMELWALGFLDDPAGARDELFIAPQIAISVL